MDNLRDVSQFNQKKPTSQEEVGHVGLDRKRSSTVTIINIITRTAISYLNQERMSIGIFNPFFGFFAP